MAEDKSPSSPYVNAAEQERKRADDFYTFYANNVSVAFSSWEMSLIFGEVTGEKDGKPLVEEIAKIIMTREFAKVLAILLSTNIAAYERRFGEITNPHFQLVPQPVDFAGLSPSSSASPSPEPPEDEESAPTE